MEIRILLVHSLCLVREGLKSMLESESGFSVVAESTDPFESVSLAEEHRPDVVVMEANMAGPHAMEAASEITRRTPSARVLFLAANSDQETVIACMHSGAAGFLPPETTPEGLTTAVRQIAMGETYLPPAALSRFVDGWRVQSGKEAPRTTDLTSREREILKLLAEGHPVKSCALALGVSPKTVEAHKFNLMRKLNIHNKAQLVHYAFQKKIVRLTLAS